MSSRDIKCRAERDSELLCYLDARFARFADRPALRREDSAGSSTELTYADVRARIARAAAALRSAGVTAGVRYKTERDRLVPITDGTTAQENQAVYVGTQFRF